MRDDSEKTVYGNRHLLGNFCRFNERLAMVADTRLASPFDAAMWHQFCFPAPATRALDAFDLRDIAGLQITAAFEQFERVFLVGQADALGAGGAQHHDRGRYAAIRLAVRRLPGKIIADAASSPFGNMLVFERRAAIVPASGVVSHCFKTSTA
ncbi:MAG TPA: hypothetical protein VFP74_15905 [Pseudolabrys sp.]|nr:hypothetical protein [Pseudolabrys sp.]